MLETVVPTKIIGPFKISGKFCSEDEEINVPLSTFESPLWYSISRGARLSRQSFGINVRIFDDLMTRSILFSSNDLDFAEKFVNEVLDIEFDNIKTIAESTSAHLKFKSVTHRVVGRNIYVRIAINSENASGHNMVTIAAQKIADYLCDKYQKLKYISVSGNYCTDKKVSSVNGILGRGKYVVAEMMVEREICRKILHTEIEKIHDINLRKNLLGSIIAGSVNSANAHFANMLLAIFLAFGQDAANIVEGSQGIVTTEIIDDFLCFSVTIPNLIVGTVGNGKTLDFALQNFKAIGCYDENFVPQKFASLRFAEIIAAVVLCGEISLLASLTVPGNLVKSHISIERKNKIFK